MYILSRSSLAHKMTWMALLAIAIALGTLIAALLVFDGISSRTLLRSRLSTLADVAGQNSAAALSFNDADAAVEVLDALRKEPPIVSACLYDLSGRLFAEYQRPHGAGMCARASNQLPPGNRQYSVVSRPVLRRGEPVGMLYLNSDHQDLNKRRTRMLLVAGILLVLALAVGGAAASLLQQKISRPIFNLARAMHDITTTDDFAARVAVSGTDEIAQLGTGFNTMVAEIERRRGERKRFEEQLQVQATTDALTGLPNRRLFADRLAQTLSLASRESRFVALLYIDLDGFKLVNDSLGHALGDILLIQVADRFQTRVRASDTLARLGGDEFTVILSTLKTPREAATVAKSLLEVLSQPFVIEDHELTICASIGISIFPDHATDAATLMRRADGAMYSAKRNGKNQARYFTSELDDLVRERLNLENELRGAVTRSEIQVYYQPEFDVNTGRLVRFEALARWIHPTLGVIPPDKFIPVAEESGMIIPLGAYVMARACAEAVTWQQVAPYPIQIAVNVSSIQFGRDTFVEEVVDVLNNTGLSPDMLQLELTESVMLNGVHRPGETMKRLKALGVGLAIDDFGTGYSCLSYLPGLPFDALKIDRSFVRELASRPESKAIFHSLVTLAHNIGMRVIVEGVENLEQLELVRKFGGNEIQGYLMGKPTPDPSSRISALLGPLEEAKAKAEAEVPVTDPVSGLLPALSRS